MQYSLCQSSPPRNYLAGNCLRDHRVHNSVMSYLIVLLFLIASLINFAPIAGAWSVDQLVRLYQIEVTDPDIALLLRHRAVLFSIVGSIILVAAFVPGLRLLATVAGWSAWPRTWCLCLLPMCTTPVC